MFRQTWKKYLPVIIFLMKRSGRADQVLDMNYTDFEKAAAGKKIRLAFSNLLIDNGRINIQIKQTALAIDLLDLLLEDLRSKSMLNGQLFEFSMNTDSQLTIKNLTLNAQSGQS